jgi:hypothetical protein
MMNRSDEGTDINILFTFNFLFEELIAGSFKYFNNKRSIRPPVVDCQWPCSRQIGERLQLTFVGFLTLKLLGGEPHAGKRYANGRNGHTLQVHVSLGVTTCQYAPCDNKPTNHARECWNKVSIS